MELNTYFGGRFETDRNKRSFSQYDVKDLYKCECGKNHLLGEE